MFAMLYLSLSVFSWMLPATSCSYFAIYCWVPKARILVTGDLERLFTLSSVLCLILGLIRSIKSLTVGFSVR